MHPTVRLNDIVDALEMQFDESCSFLDRDTARWKPSPTFFCVRQRSPATTRNRNLPTCQTQEWEVAKLIVSIDRFQKLSTKFEVHEWAIMQDFSHSVQPDRIREDLLLAIHGAGAFRNFNETLRRHRIESAWFAFRTEALRQIALNWCEENHIVWV